MWFVKQGPALSFHDAHPSHYVIAEDISGHGHKRYGVFPESVIDARFNAGPFCELIRTHKQCRLHFDLDGGPEHTESNIEVAFIQHVVDFIHQVYGTGQGHNTAHAVLCSSTREKYSKHIIFPFIIFRNNHAHMRAFCESFCRYVGSINEDFAAIMDTAIYTRHRCFRMAGCHKFGQTTRVFRPGRPSEHLIQVDGVETPLEFVAEEPRQRRGGGGGGGGGGRCKYGRV